ncbi:protein pigeon isoform X2 [Onthophagus taurus]|uniref:protein pigeon isoform X2 n=1 Tax=Onthophagus taurus TaxID=166361 RepID=UPI000C207A30|nr:protein pigeon [Onthophagus taurus]
MVIVDNIVGKLYPLVINEGIKEHEINEWRLLGQEKDSVILFSWVEKGENLPPSTHIGTYKCAENVFKKIFSLPKIENVIQATINTDHTLLGYVIKTTKEDDEVVYRPFLVKIGENCEEPSCDLKIERTKQVMIQFLYYKRSILNENPTEKLLVFIHEECIMQYTLTNEIIKMVLNPDKFHVETMVKIFLWAQWDAVHQTLYYIHHRKPIRSFVDGEDSDFHVCSQNSNTSPTLSGMQFHDDLPYESVLNIPLNLPHLSFAETTCNLYEDDTVPLRIHNCSLDLIVLTDPDGGVCVCHHYLYQPVKSSYKLEDEDECPVNFAYSVTVLHHGCIIHCVIPGIPWKQAKCIRPLFMFYGDHMLVSIPSLCIHLLDIGFLHEPCCHIVLNDNNTPSMDLNKISLTTIRGLGDSNFALNVPTLDIIDFHLPTKELVDTFKSINSLENRLSILHYLIVHRNEAEAVVELVQFYIEQQIIVGTPQIFKEFLIGNCYASVCRTLPSDANQLIELLPVTTQATGCDVEVEVNEKVRVCISQDALWNASMMLLSPQQRVVPYRVDIWVKLWERLLKNAKSKQKFRPAQVAEKLLVSLVCYQPEALSRSTTPMSPIPSSNLTNLPKDIASIKNPVGSLPFYEVESCTASKQEHIISVNLRELSMHLLKQSTDNKISRFQWQSQTPMHVHAVATRYVGAQLEQSRNLCQILCKACVKALCTEEKGFLFIDQLPEELRFILFTTLEQYCLAIESIAFPLPLGFTSFFTFLGYRTLEYDIFLQYVQRHVFELQIDVMKIIMTDMDDTTENIKRKLSLLSFLPRMRAKRLLNQWHHPVSLMIRAREHATNILSGVEGQNVRLSASQKTTKYQLGFAAFPTHDRLSPLDTFLDLLTAKASLNELDFGLLIEATISSIDNVY